LFNLRKIDVGCILYRLGISQPTKSDGLDRLKQTSTIALGGSVVLLSLIVGALLQYGCNIGFARLFGAGTFGLFAFGMGFINVMAIVGQLGTREMFIRYVAVYRGTHDTPHLRGLLLFGLFLGLVGSIVFTLLLGMNASSIAQWAKKTEAEDVLRRLAILVPPFAIVGLVATALQGAKAFGRSFSLSEIGRPVALIVALGLAWSAALPFDRFLTAYKYVFYLIALSSLFWFRDLFKGGDEGKSTSFAIADWLPFTLPVALLELIRSGEGYADTLLLGFLCSAKDVGVYYAAQRTGLLVVVVLAAFNAVLSPLAADLWHRRDITELDRVFKLTTRWTCMLALPIFAATMLVRNDLMALFGPEFHIGATPLLIILVGQMVNALTGGVGRLLVMTGHQRLELVNTVVSLTTLAISMVWAVPRYGLLGAALANCFVLSAINILKLVEVRFMIGIQPYEPRYWKPLVAAIGAWLVGWTFKSIFLGNGVTSNLVLVPIAVGFTYWIILLKLGIEAEERCLVQSALSWLPFSKR
jgi:O-antigen/teichoic acid export membrane protein